jgi:hypothetical protein
MSRVLYLQGPSELLNPTLDKGVIAAAYEDDPEAARAEWGGQFRQDVTAYLPDDAIQAALCPGERSRVRLPELLYVGFVDAAGGGGVDAMTCAVAHQGERGRVFADQLIAIDPPFDTESAVERCAMLLKAYGITQAQSDRYAGLWPAQSFARHGITLIPCELDKSAIYREVAPLFVSRLVSLVDDTRLEVELRALERTPRAGGRPDAIDHPSGQGSHDDRVNAVAGALWMASRLPAGLVAGFTGGVTHSITDYDPLTHSNDGRNTGGPYQPAPRYYGGPALVLSTASRAQTLTDWQQEQ